MRVTSIIVSIKVSNLFSCLQFLQTSVSEVTLSKVSWLKCYLGSVAFGVYIHTLNRSVEPKEDRFDGLRKNCSLDKEAKMFFKAWEIIFGSSSGKYTSDSLEYKKGVEVNHSETWLLLPKSR